MLRFRLTSLLRFHLSTLLLLCIFAGAVIGLGLNNKVWQLEYTLPFQVDDVREFSPYILAVDDAGAQLVAVCDTNTVYKFDLRTKGLRWAKRLDFAPFMIERVRFSKYGKTIQGAITLGEIVWNLDATDGAGLSSERGDKSWYPKDMNPFTDAFECSAKAPNHIEWVIIHRERIVIGSEVPQGVFDFKEINVPTCAGYFKDGNRLAIGGENYLGVWRRMRNYGWIGFFELPLTWIAIATFAALSVIFLRWLRGILLGRRTRNV